MDDGTMSLLCDEDSGSLCFDDDDDGGGEVVDENRSILRHDRSDLEQPLAFLPPFLSQECIDWMIERERFHMVRDDYLTRLRTGELDRGFRTQALDWMLKACARHNFGELCLCVAMNYLDRFLSVYDLPVGKTWAIQLVAVTCLSLAAKLDEVHVPSILGLQEVESKHVFEGKTIQRTEILVLSSLNWNIKPYTPLSFIDYFLRKLNDDESLTSRLVSRSVHVITSTIRGIDFLEFKPSEIAAAVAIHVSGETKQTMDIDKALSSLIIVEKEKVLNCLQLIQDFITIGGTTNITDGLSLVPKTPIGHERTRPSHDNSSDAKRQRLN